MQRPDRILYERLLHREFQQLHHDQQCRRRAIVHQHVCTGKVWSLDNSPSRCDASNCVFRSPKLMVHPCNCWVMGTIITTRLSGTLAPALLVGPAPVLTSTSSSTAFTWAPTTRLSPHALGVCGYRCGQALGREWIPVACFGVCFQKVRVWTCRWNGYPNTWGGGHPGDGKVYTQTTYISSVSITPFNEPNDIAYPMTIDQPNGCQEYVGQSEYSPVQCD